MAKKARRQSPARQKKRKPGKQPTPRWRVRLVCIFAGLLGLTAGVGGCWIYAISSQVVVHFEQRRWDVPSRVYARPLTVYAGMPLTSQLLRNELQAAGYQSSAEPAQPGQYSIQGNSYVIHTRPFAFADGLQAAQIIKFQLIEKTISGLQVGGNVASLARLDPAEIGSLHTLGGDDRTVLQLTDFPELLVTGIQAVEDRNFKRHHGIDWRGLARALWRNVSTGSISQGGSTITQQMVRNLYLTNNRNLWRKFNEMVMAISLEHKYSKHEILETYLNQVYLGQIGGRGIHGFARASQFYFGVPVQSLQPHQTALLIGMVRGASWYNPRRHRERAMARRNVILDSFAATGLLRRQQAEQWQSLPLAVRDQPGYLNSQYPAFMDLVRRQLREEYAEDELQREGLRVLTTLDPAAQLQAERAAREGLSRVEQSRGWQELQTGMVIADPNTGDLLALVGDRNPDRAGFNRAVDARRQIGSIIKPFVYLLALANGDNLMTQISDAAINIPMPNGETWQPQNYDLQNHGSVPLLTALIQSYNQATVRLGMGFGPERLADLLRRLELLPETALPHPSLLLGALELSPLEVASLYQVLAADGYRTRLSAVREVLDSNGRALTRYPVQLDIFPQREAIPLITFALTDVTKRGTAWRLRQMLGREASIAAKTGTTNDQRDSWFVGYTDDRLAVVWVGRDDNQPAGIAGSTAAMPIWAEMFNGMPLRNIDVYRLPGLTWYWVDWLDGWVTDANCPGAGLVPFRAGSEPVQWRPCRN